jgi:hypothetical protein
LAISPRLIQFGDVDQGAICQAEFELVNYFEVPVRILNVSSSCTCSKAEVSNPTLQPKERCIISSRWNTRGLRGQAKADLFVRYQIEGEGWGEFPLSMRGNVIPALEVTPYPVTIPMDKPKELVVQIKATKFYEGSSAPVKRSWSLHPAFHIETLNPNSFRLKFDPKGLENASLVAEVFVETNNENEPTIQIPIVWSDPSTPTKGD